MRKIAFIIMAFFAAGMLAQGCDGNFLDATKGSSAPKFTHAPFTSDSSTIGLWHMNEGMGQMVSDSSGNGLHLHLGMYADADTRDPTWDPDGTDGACLYFDDTSSQHQFVCNTTAFNYNFPGQQFSVELWHKTTIHYWGFLFNTEPMICSMVWGSGGVDLHFYKTDDVAGTDYVFDDVVYLHADSTIIDGEWHYLAFTYSSGVGQIYVDGVMRKSGSMTPTAYPSLSTIEIGGSVEGDAYIIGYIDEVRFSNIERIASEISDYYNQ